MDKLEVAFVLDERLVKDSIVLGDLPLCRLLLINDQQFPWFVLVPRRAGVEELYHLSLPERAMLMAESCDLSAALADAYAADKMNVAALGNIVKQLHLHHVVRYETDVAWPGPIWGQQPAKAYTKDQIADIRIKVSNLLEAKLDFQAISD